MNSAALLLRSASSRHPEGLANSSGLVGKRYMAHLATMMQGFHPLRKNDTVFQKTVAINDFYLKGPKTRYPLGQIQSQGRTHGVMAQNGGAVGAGVGLRRVGRAGVDWLAMTEDLPRLDNKVTIDRDGRIHLHYSPNNVNAHKQLVRETKKILRKLGYWIVMTHSTRPRTLRTSAAPWCSALIRNIPCSIPIARPTTSTTCRRRVVLPHLPR